MNCGIYTIENLTDNKLYVGYALNFPKRWAVHRNDLRKNKHQNPYLQAAWNKYGEESFKFEILEECDKEFLCSQENYWCNMLGVSNPIIGYNLKETSPDCRCGNSEETKQRMSEARKEWIKDNPDYNPFEKMSQESKDKQFVNRKRRKIIQYDLNGQKIREYQSLSKVLDFGFNNVSVQNCCSKRVRFYKGFVFRYDGDAFSIEKGKIKSKFQNNQIHL